MKSAFDDDAIKLLVVVESSEPHDWLTERLGPVIHETGDSPWWSTSLTSRYTSVAADGTITTSPNFLKGQHLFRIGCPYVAFEFKVKFC